MLSYKKLYWIIYKYIWTVCLFQQELNILVLYVKAYMRIWALHKCLFPDLKYLMHKNTTLECNFYTKNRKKYMRGCFSKHIFTSLKFVKTNQQTNRTQPLFLCKKYHLYAFSLFSSLRNLYFGYCGYHCQLRVFIQ